MELHTAYQPGFIYLISGSRRAHVYMVDSGRVIGALEIWTACGLREIEGEEWDAATGAQGFGGVRGMATLDLPALPCRPFGRVPDFTAAPTAPSTAEEIADKVVERLVGLRIDTSVAPTPAETTKAVDRFQAGRKSGRDGFKTELLMELHAAADDETNAAKRETLYAVMTMVNQMGLPKPGSVIREAAE